MSDPSGAARVRPLQRAVHAVFGTDQGFTRYCLLAWHVALVGSIALVLMAFGVLESAGEDAAALAPPAEVESARDMFRTVFLAPLIESLVLVGLLWGLGKIIPSIEWQAIVAGFACGAAHGAFYPLWFFGTVFSFYVFSRGYLAWRAVSFKHAFGAAALPHALVNSTVLLVQYFSRS
jgi:hypothetical protein